jgi:hypothetical protein
LAGAGSSVISIQPPVIVEFDLPGARQRYAQARGQNHIVAQRSGAGKLVYQPLKVVCQLDGNLGDLRRQRQAGEKLQQFLRN